MKPLTAETLRALALHYVGRYATSSGKLRLYLQRKLRDRGWEASDEPPLDDLIGQFVDAGYVDDAGYASAKRASLLRRGFGAARVRQTLRHSGVGTELAERESRIDDESARQAALDFARRKHIGPFARAEPDPRQRQKDVASMLRAGHDFSLIREILAMPAIT